MLDPGLIQYLQPPPPPSRPPMVIERSRVERASAAPDARARWVVDGFIQSVTAWRQILDANRQALELRAGTIAIDASELAALTRMIGLLEEAAELAAEDAARFRRASARRVTAILRDDPAMGAMAKTVARGLADANDAIVRTLLDHALFLRALRAEHDPDARGGPEFDDAEALERHLLSAFD